MAMRTHPVASRRLKVSVFAVIILAGTRNTGAGVTFFRFVIKNSLHPDQLSIAFPIAISFDHFNIKRSNEI
jgi:hypothetical protein